MPQLCVRKTPRWLDGVSPSRDSRAIYLCPMEGETPSSRLTQPRGCRCRIRMPDSVPLGSPTPRRLFSVKDQCFRKSSIANRVFPVMISPVTFSDFPSKASSRTSA